MKEKEMKKIAEWITKVSENIKNEDFLLKIKEEVKEFCSDFPAPGISI